MEITFIYFLSKCPYGYHYVPKHVTQNSNSPGFQLLCTEFIHSDLLHFDLYSFEFFFVVLQAIEERREFLSEMEQLGQGKQYRTQIETEISQVCVSFKDFTLEILSFFVQFVGKNTFNLIDVS